MSASLLPLSTLLCEGGWEGKECGVWRVLEVMSGLGDGGGDYSSHCQVLANVLSFYFSCLAQTTSHLKHGRELPVLVPANSVFSV